MRSGVCVLWVAEAPGIFCNSYAFAVSVLPQSDVISSKQTSLCGFPVNTSQGELVDVDEAF